MSVFAKLASMLGIREDQVDDALKSERAARATLSRRGLLLVGVGAAGALVTGAHMVEIAKPDWVITAWREATGIQGTATPAMLRMLVQKWQQADGQEVSLWRTVERNSVPVTFVVDPELSR